MDATVAGGNIDVGDARGAVAAHGSSGHIHINFSNVPKSESRLEVAGGGIKVGLPKNAALDVDARASGGKVSSDMPVATLASGRTGNHGVLEGKLNGGGPALVLRSSSGDIRITKSPAVQAEAEK